MERSDANTSDAAGLLSSAQENSYHHPTIIVHYKHRQHTNRHISSSQKNGWIVCVCVCICVNMFVCMGVCVCLCVRECMCRHLRLFVCV